MEGKYSSNLFHYFDKELLHENEPCYVYPSSRYTLCALYLLLLWSYEPSHLPNWKVSVDQIWRILFPLDGNIHHELKMATLDSLKGALRQKATAMASSQTQPLSDTQ